MDLSWVVSVSYRERIAKHTDLGVDLNFLNARSTGVWSTGGLAGGLDVHATLLDLRYLQFSPYLDVRMDPKGNAVIRFGPQLGVKVSEQITGRNYNWSVLNGGIEEALISELEAAGTDHFNDVDLRVMIGFGFRFGNGVVALTFDPYFSYGLNKLMETRHYQERSMMLGARLGLARRFDRKPFTRLVQGNAPDRSEEP